MRSVLVNLGTYFAALQHGVKPLQIRYGFMHTEPLGVIAIDQRGGGANLAQTRLYVYADADERVLHLITLGDKRSQKEDIKTCRSYVLELRERKTNRNDSGKDEPDEGSEAAAVP